MLENIELSDLLHRRIIDNCYNLFKDKYYTDAASSAMRQVEIALKEKTGEKNLFGVRLINKYLSQNASIRLVSQINGERQDIIKKYFEATFSYYRNYTAHDGRNIDNKMSIRILIIASELLELLNASSLSLANIGGIDAVISNGIFESKNQMKKIIDILKSETIVDDTFDGLWETLYLSNNYTEDHFNKLFELGIIQYRTEMNGIEDINGDLVDYGFFELTELGNNIYKEL